MTAGASRTIEVAVVIPAYNRERLIGRAVSSALLQSHAPVEVVVVDDGSSDGTAAAAEACGARVVRQANSGRPGIARNVGAATVDAPWIAFLDSDDEWLPHHLETLTSHVEPDLVLIASRARSVPGGGMIGHASSSPVTISPDTLLWPDNPLSPSTAMVRADALRDTGGFPDHPLGEDLYFWTRLAAVGRGIVLPDVTALYHEHGSQISANAEEMQAALLAIVEELVASGAAEPRTLEHIRVRVAWDRFRDKGRDAPLTAEQRRLLRSPSSVPSLAQLWAFRLRRRRQHGL